MLGQLSLDENNEVRVHLPHPVLPRALPTLPHKVRHHNHASGLHLLSQANRTDQRNAGGIWFVISQV